MGRDDDWADQRLKVAHDEARAVIEAQNRTMADIDDKAMRTVRMTAVLIGILITALQVDQSAFDETVISASILCLVGAAIVGITTYDESDLFVGPAGEYLREIGTDGGGEDAWGEELIDTYSGMILENHDSLQENARLLHITQTFLIAGIVLAVAATAI